MINSDMYGATMFDPLLELPGYSLRRAAAKVMGEFVLLLEPLGLRLSEVSALLLVEANPAITASQLGRMLEIQRANMVPLVARLEHAGLIDREPINGKSHGLRLTERGTARVAEAREVIGRFETELVERVPEQHRAHLKPALDALWR